MKKKVSICVITFNQVKYIGPCLQSILNQHTDFEFEVVVGDDFSTDGTREIVREFADRYPDKMVPLLHPQRVGGSANFMAVHNLAGGTYVAHIDGDDMALPGKLQAQVDYLDAHADCTIVWHRMNLFNDSGTLDKENLPNVRMFENGRICLSDVLRFGSIGYHSSMMYRANARKTRYISGEVLDFYYSVEMLMSGYGKYLDGVFGGYRYNINTGISNKGRGSSFVMKVYADHLRYYLRVDPKLKKDIFINCLICFIVGVKNRRISALIFFKLSVRTFSFLSPWEFLRCMRRFRQINAGI